MTKHDTEGMDSTMSGSILVREPLLDGIWYPDTREEFLEALQSAPSSFSSLAPHCSAMLLPFGPFDEVASLIKPAFLATKDIRWKRAILLGPCESKFRPRIFLPESLHFRSILGNSPVDQQALELFLDASMLFEKDDTPHLSENSLEISLTMLHYTLSSIPILPVLLGGGNPNLFRSLLSAIRLLDHELEGPNLFLLNGNCQNYPGQWEEIIKGNPDAFFSPGCKLDFNAPTTVLFALGASFSQKRGIFFEHFTNSTGMGTILFN